MPTLKVNSKKDVLFQIFTLGMIGFFIGIVTSELFSGNTITGEMIWSYFLMLLVSGFLLWCYYGTYYELTQTHLKYNFGPIKGHIEIKEIREIIKNKTLWVGLKPATARKGLIIKYRKFDEIYISPETNDKFVSHILTINDAIKITAHSKPSL
jgi:hypothetical protein